MGTAGSVVVQSDHKTSLLILLSCTPVANKLMNRCFPTPIKRSKKDNSQRVGKNEINRTAICNKRRLALLQKIMTSLLFSPNKSAMWDYTSAHKSRHW